MDGIVMLSVNMQDSALVTQGCMLTERVLWAGAIDSCQIGNHRAVVTCLVNKTRALETLFSVISASSIAFHSQSIALNPALGLK